MFFDVYRLGERYVNVTNLYDTGFRELCLDIAGELDYLDHVLEGSYAMVSGPSTATPAELKLLVNASCDVVGKLLNKSMSDLAISDVRLRVSK